uniref:Protein kinase domain-containing protein n=1 Tax=Oryza punctata TaxID=4537 RepID=A0A0E0JWP9_ORYPU
MAERPRRIRGGAGLALVIVLLLLAVAARAQQEYEANLQNACYATNASSTLGYTCNATSAAAAPCDAYLLFRSSPPLYASAVSISYLLNATAAAVADSNAVDPVSPVAADRLVLAPVPCGCSPGGYYQHNASHTIRDTGVETYFIIANLTYQGLSTCQALIAQNPLHDSRNLVAGDNLTVPLRCACPSPAQVAAGVKHMVTYLVTWGDTVSAIAARFRVDTQDVVVDVSSSAEYGALASGKQTTTMTTSSSSLSAVRSLMASDVREALESLTVYKYSELEKATVGFSEERRVPGTAVYRGVFNGDAAVVKRVAGDVSGEVAILKRVNHCSLIRLSGLCVHRGDTYLVFEYAENGALSDWLHGGGRTSVLGWRQRVQVAFDVADGLNYLHHYTNPPCVHKNIKSSNILLDADLHGKMSSFGLARALPEGDGAAAAQLTRHVVGTQGYLSPEYLEHGLITPKLDVFAFGVILLELLSGKEAAYSGGGDDEKGETLLWESAEVLVDGGGEDAGSKVRAFMDPRLGGDYPLDLAMAVASLAARCVARQPGARPGMDEVFISLAAVYNSTVDWDPSDHGNSGSSLIGR